VTFEGMQAAVAEVLDRLGDHRDELSTLMTERFAIVEPAVPEAGSRRGPVNGGPESKAEGRVVALLK